MTSPIRRTAWWPASWSGDGTSAWLRCAISKLEIDRLDADKEPTLTEADRERLMALGQDLVQAWESPGATSETRKKIIRTVISEIIVDIIGDTLELDHPLARRRPHPSAP